MSTLVYSASRDWSAVTLAEMTGWIFAMADGVEAAQAPYWITAGPDFDAYGIYCERCAEQKVRAIYRVERKKATEYGVRVDGGFSTTVDSLPRCKTCNCRLDGSLTDYAVQSEIEHVDAYWPESADAWADLELALLNVCDDDITLDELRARGHRDVWVWEIVAPIVLDSMRRFGGAQ